MSTLNSVMSGFCARSSISPRRSLLFSLTVFLMPLGLAACAGDIGDEAGPHRMAEQAIYYGTRSPSVTNLSAGEQMAIGYLADASGSMFCSATLIDRDVAVTAQHCVVDTYAVNEMRFGMGDPNSPSALIPVHSAPYHPSMDVALLFLQQDAVSQVPSAEPIPFLRESANPAWVGTDVEAAGYGATHDDSTGRYFVQLELEDIDEDYFVVNGRGQRGICFGDSGGPLFVHVGSGEPVIAGVESHGDASCVDQDFLTRLDVAANWIDSQMAAFDPQSAPQTGPQGDGDYNDCDPGASGWDAAGQSGKCGGFPLPICTSSPTVGLPYPWLAAFGLFLFLVRLRRGRRTTEPRA